MADLIISVKDSLRQSVEAASGGRVTVLYDRDGLPNYMVQIPKFNMADIDAELPDAIHPAFIVNGVEKDRIWIGQHIASLHDDKYLSIPDQVPLAAVSLSNASTAISGKGPGWHIMTNAEWAAIQLWCMANGTWPNGNTDHGKSYNDPHETGTLANPPSEPAQPTYAGSGPNTWRHDYTYQGISDLVGNYYEWISGVRLVDGEIQVIPDNDAAGQGADISDTSPLWKAILYADGSLVAPGTSGTVKLDDINSGTSGHVGAGELNTSIVNSGSPDGYVSMDFNALTKNAGLGDIPGILRQLALHGEWAGADNKGRLLFKNYGTRSAQRGANFESPNGGITELKFMYTSAQSPGYTSFRVAYIE